MLQNVAARFHLPSVNNAKINTVQYPQLHNQCEIQTDPSVLISKVPFLQSNIMADIVHSHRILLSDISSGLPTYKKHITQFAIIIVLVVVVVVAELPLLLLLLLSTNSNLVLFK
jgi:hypothetical protein